MPTRYSMFIVGSNEVILKKIVTTYKACNSFLYRYQMRVSDGCVYLDWSHSLPTWCDWHSNGHQYFRPYKCGRLEKPSSVKEWYSQIIMKYNYICF